jgi:hypothetical protein
MRRDSASDTGKRARAPAKDASRQVGWGSQSEDFDAPSAFKKPMGEPDGKKPKR